jgi:hypothetical protein
MKNKLEKIYIFFEIEKKKLEKHHRIEKIKLTKKIFIFLKKL